MTLYYRNNKFPLTQSINVLFLGMEMDGTISKAETNSFPGTVKSPSTSIRQMGGLCTDGRSCKCQSYLCRQREEPELAASASWTCFGVFLSFCNYHDSRLVIFLAYTFQNQEGQRTTMQLRSEKDLVSSLSKQALSKNSTLGR